MSTASEQAATFLAKKQRERATTRRAASGDYARLSALLAKDELTDDESAEFDELAQKRRSGTLAGSPTRTTYKRESTAGASDRDGGSGARPDTPLTASEQAARILQGHN